MINKRILSTLLALAILLSCVGWTPAQAQGAALVDAAGTKQYIYPTGACSSTNSDVYCVFTIDVNEMQRYTDNVIPLDFAIQGQCRWNTINWHHMYILLRIMKYRYAFLYWNLGKCRMCQI